MPHSPLPLTPAWLTEQLLRGGRAIAPTLPGAAAFSSVPPPLPPLPGPQSTLESFTAAKEATPSAEPTLPELPSSVGGPGASITRGREAGTRPFEITEAFREGAFDPTSIPEWGGVDGLMTRGQMETDLGARGLLSARHQAALDEISRAEQERELSQMAPLEAAAQRSRLQALAKDPFAEERAKGEAAAQVARAPGAQEREFRLEDVAKLKEIEAEVRRVAGANPEFQKFPPIEREQRIQAAIAQEYDLYLKGVRGQLSYRESGLGL